MTLSETTQTLAVLGPVFGVVSAVLSGALWLVRRHVRQLDEQIDGLKRGNELLTVRAERAETAEARADRAEEDRRVAEQARIEAENARDIAVTDRDTERARTKKAAEAANINYNAWKSSDGKRQSAEARAEKAEKDGAELASKLAAAEEQLTSLKACYQESDERATAATEQITTLKKDLRIEKAARVKAEQTAGQNEIEKVALEGEKTALEAELGTLKETNEEQQKSLERYEAQIELVAKHDGRVWQTVPQAGTPDFIPLTNRGTPVISLLNLKGGVGKTTIAANLAAYFDKELGQRVLLIDLDHQRSLSQQLLSPAERRLAANAGKTIQRFLKSESKDGTALLDCSKPVPGMNHCSIITNADPADDGELEAQSLDDLEMRLMTSWVTTPSAGDVRFLLRSALQSETIRKQFQLVLIDCPPRLTTACVNALVGSDYLLVPAQPEPISLASVYHLLRRLQPLRECKLLAHLRLLGIVANMVRPAGLASDSHERVLLAGATKTSKGIWKGDVRCFKTLLRRHDQYAEATQFLQTGDKLRLAIHYKGVRDDFTDLVDELQKVITNESRVAAAVSS